MRATTLSRGALALLAAIAAGCEREPPAEAPPEIRGSIEPRVESVGGLQARRTEIRGLVADLLSAKWERGFLTVSVRFRNAGRDTVAFTIPADGGLYTEVRLEAGGRRWSIARDEKGDPEAPERFGGTLMPGQSMLWRASYVAPPPGVTTFDLVMPGLRRPFIAIPITDEPDQDGGA